MAKSNALSEKISWKPLIIAAIFALVLARIVDKEISLPMPVVLAAAVLGGGVLLLSSLLHPELPLYVLAAYIPFSRILPGDFGGVITAFNFTNLLCVMAMIGLLARSTRSGGFWQKASMNIPILLFMLVGTFSILRGTWEYGDWYFWRMITSLKRWLTPMFLYFLTLWIVRDRRTLKMVVTILLISVAVVGLLTVKEYIDVGEVGSIEKERVGGIADQPNELAGFFVYYMFLFGAFFLMNSSKPRYWLLLIPFLVCFRGIQVTFSRGGYIAFFFGALALSFFRSRILFFFVVLALVIGFLNPVLLPRGIVYRLLSTFRNVEPAEEGNLSVVASDIYKGENLPLENSAQSRLVIWKGALKMIADYPIWGTGYGTFGAVIPYYAPELGGRRMDAHNSYLLIAGEMGIPALLVFLWIIGLLMWKTFRLYQTAKDPFVKAMALGFLAGVFGFVMTNMFGSRVEHEEIAGYFWILSALVIRALLLEEEAAPQTSGVVRVRRKRAAWKTVPAPAAAAPHSLSASLRRVDEMKHGVKRWRSR